MSKGLLRTLIGSSMVCARAAEGLGQEGHKGGEDEEQKVGGPHWSDISELAALVRSGEKTWEELNLDDVDVRTKWAGLFHRKKRAPGTFMMRLKVGHS